MSAPARAWRVDALDVRDVRCWPRASVAFPPGVSVLTGHNGAGKTSLVEAVVLAAVGASPRTNQLGDVVAHGAPAFHVHAALTRPDGATAVRDIGYQPRVGRRLAADGVPAARLMAWRLPGSVLVFVPEELRAVKGPPAARRRGLDRVLEAVVPGFTQALADYAAALAQRNAILRRARGGADRAALGQAYVWETQMGRAGARIVAARRDGLARLGGPFAAWLEALGGAPGGAVRREPSPRRLADVPDDEWAAAFAAYLDERRERDAAAGMTLAGPHRDDLWMGWDDLDARRLGSQGEQRTVALALLLAYRDLLAGAAALPVLLLDDVLSELDPLRRSALLDAVARDGQTIITTADTRYRVTDDVPDAAEIRVPADIAA